MSINVELLLLPPPWCSFPFDKVMGTPLHCHHFRGKCIFLAAADEEFVLKEAFDEMYDYEESLHLLLLLEQPMQGRKLTLFLQPPPMIMLEVNNRIA